MTAALKLAPLERYDDVCAYCYDGRPVVRYRGKACCEKCGDVFLEGTATTMAWPAPSLRALIRFLEGRRPRDYLPELWQRALDARGSRR